MNTKRRNNECCLNLENNKTRRKGLLADKLHIARLDSFNKREQRKLPIQLEQTHIAQNLIKARFFALNQIRFAAFRRDNKQGWA